MIEAELKDAGIKRVETFRVAGTDHWRGRQVAGHRPIHRKNFLRMLRLSALDSISMSDDQRDAFINMAENLGIDAVKPRTLSIFTWRRRTENRSRAQESGRTQWSVAKPLKPQLRSAANAPARPSRSTSRGARALH